jgi:hypothetical protein
LPLVWLKTSHLSKRKRKFVVNYLQLSVMLESQNLQTTINSTDLELAWI